MIRLGIDIGSTTVKLVALDDRHHMVFSQYERHYSDVRESLIAMLKKASDRFGQTPMAVAITGSGGLLLAKKTGIGFEQEVIAQAEALGVLMPDADVAVELGGEDAKIVYLTNGREQRMNGTCAGGTGSFIDQMASLLQTDAQGLDRLAEQATTLHPIASRCGVFAKTDIQPLINEGVAKEDIAASIFQAVVTQTVAGLACGRPIRGKVAFLGGPLNYLPQLLLRFVKTLKLTKSQTGTLPDAHLVVAFGAALCASTHRQACLSADSIIQRIQSVMSDEQDLSKLPPLFENDQQRQEFLNRHRTHIEKTGIEQVKGPIYVGIDAGSTTAKMVAIDQNGAVVFERYGSNRGDPLRQIIDMIRKLYRKMEKDAFIAYAGVTGYGESLIKTALNLDTSEIETIAHYESAKTFMPNVDFILDIGGQDMKCMHVKDGVIDRIMLNEACSSGCGSFLETFASMLGLDLQTFCQKAMYATSPVDLGSRCTVFMNSRIKQAQKEGVPVADIAAGLAYSVIKNALFKVIKMKGPESLGRNIVVQGGTFLNDAVLRAFEMVLDKPCVRPPMAGLMGAYGMALLAKSRFVKGKSTMSDEQALASLTIQKKHARCEGCKNRCPITINYFSGRTHVTGNRCEKGAGVKTDAADVPNLMQYKLDRLFSYRPHSKKLALRGTVGLPRALNMYENYPFWFTFFHTLGYRVCLSAPSSKRIFEKGIDSIPSESVCYPAKLCHGHIMDLLEKDVSFIFMPCIEKEQKEDERANNGFNCPIVTGYPEVLKNNMDALRSENVRFYHPFVPYHRPKAMKKQLAKVLQHEGLSTSDIAHALDCAYKEQARFQQDVKKEGERVLRQIVGNGQTGFVLAGRPYHVDPEINHGIADLIASYGIAVLTEDSIAHKSRLERPLRVNDQWTYHTRMYHAADVVTQYPSLQLVQLNSFGCGLDAVTIEQIEEILQTASRIHTVLKIDEISNLGAVKIRLRSLLAGMRAQLPQPPKKQAVCPKVEFTKSHAKTHTILAPQMSPIHFELLEAAFESENVKLQVLDKVEPQDVEYGLKTVNNDACYPSIIVVGQMVRALKSGRYDPDHTSLIITQTGGGCRASNYIAFLRKALHENGLSHVPVISLNALGMEKHEGFRYAPVMIRKAIKAMIYGDVLMKLLLAVRPYETKLGDADRMYKKWVGRCKQTFQKKVGNRFRRTVYEMIAAFDRMELLLIEKPKVGLVGEILVKYHPFANNEAIAFVEEEGCEAMVPDLTGFFLYCLYNSVARRAYGAASMLQSGLSRFFIRLMESYRKHANAYLEKSERFSPFHNIHDLAKKAKKVLSTGHCMGEGWLLTAEMLALIDDGVENIVCMQPFACLPNHVTGKGMLKKIKMLYPNSNIVAIDYDPGASEVNQMNRMKLMLSVASKNRIVDEKSTKV